MKISRNWLNDFIDVRGTGDEELAALMTSIGHAVEGIESHGDDIVFEIEFTTNRVDAMSHAGLARELSAALGRPLKRSDAPSIDPATRGEEIEVRIDAPELCSRYSGMLIRGVRVGPPSDHVRRRLEATGHRSINNIVDATNYVMLALGHPLHAFDLDRLEGRRIVVRAGGDDESIVTLDGQTRTIDRSTVVIADAQRAVALGGVMGGENSEVHPGTTDILLEAAWFEPRAIRKTARRLGLKSDASYRFERGVDPSDTLQALSLAAQLILSEAGGRIIETVDVIAAPRPPRSVLLRRETIRGATGSHVSTDQAVELLRRLGMRVNEERDGLEVVLPSWRGDLAEEMDLIEELLRFHGYDRIPAELPQIPTGDVRHEPVADAEERTRDLLVAAGLAEVVTYGFVHPRWNRRISTSEAPVELTNALNENLSSMRLSIVPGLLEVAQHNRSYGNRDGAIFEVGRTYHWNENVVEERRTAAFVLFGSRPSGWGEAKATWSYYDAKGVIERIAAAYGVELEAEPLAAAGWVRQGATLRTSDGRKVASAGVVAPELLGEFELKGDIVAGEVDLEALVASEAAPFMKPVSRFPGVPMVVAMYHSPTLSYGEIVAAIRRIDAPHLREVGLWDRFVQPGSADVKTAIGLWYQADDRSLSQEEVAEIHSNLTKQLADAIAIRLIN